MGSTTFFTVANGDSVEDAFRGAVKEAERMYGQAGYTGTIAEKQDFVIITCPREIDAHEFAEYLIRKRDKRVNDSYGPAGCIVKENGEYLFFGWAPE